MISLVCALYTLWRRVSKFYDSKRGKAVSKWSVNGIGDANVSELEGKDKSSDPLSSHSTGVNDQKKGIELGTFAHDNPLWSI